MFLLPAIAFGNRQIVMTMDVRNHSEGYEPRADERCGCCGIEAPAGAVTLILAPGHDETATALYLVRLCLDCTEGGIDPERYGLIAEGIRGRIAQQYQMSN